MAKNRPPAAVTLFAPKASLVVRKDLHPAIQSLLLDAAEQVHSGPGIFHQTRQFPAAEAVDLPLSDEARQYYRSGRPFLQRHLPFWLAVAIGRLLVFLIPLVGVMYPLFRLMPALYAWNVRRRIVRMYRDLKDLEKDGTSPGALRRGSSGWRTRPATSRSRSSTATRSTRSGSTSPWSASASGAPLGPRRPSDESPLRHPATHAGGQLLERRRAEPKSRPDDGDVAA